MLRVVHPRTVSACSDGVMTNDELMDERLIFKYDPIQAEVTVVSSVSDQDVLNGILNDRMALSKFYVAVGSITTEKHTDCVIFKCMASVDASTTPSIDATHT